MQAASIVCGSEAKSAGDSGSDSDADAVTTPSPSEVNKFVHSLQWLRIRKDKYTLSSFITYGAYPIPRIFAVLRECLMASPIVA